MPAYDKRKIKYSRELVRKACQRISQGAALSQVAEMSDMPPLGTLFEWINTDDYFTKEYARARESRAELLFQEILDIADDTSGDVVEVEDKKGRKYQKTDHENIQRAKLRVDTRKWYLSKLLPRKFSDRMIHAGDEDAPLATKELNSQGKAVLQHFIQHHEDKLNTIDVEAEEVHEYKSDNIHYDKHTNYENKKSRQKIEGGGREVGSFSSASPSGSNNAENFEDFC